MKKCLKNLLAVILAMSMLFSIAPMTFAGDYDDYDFSSYLSQLPEGHNYDSGKLVDNDYDPCYPLIEFTCLDCGFTATVQQFYIENHKWVYVSGYPATCGEDGLTDGEYCEVCGLWIVFHEVIPATGNHTPSDEIAGTSTTYPTCTESGEYIEECYCADCGEIIETNREVLEPLGHSYNAVETPPTCTDAGYTTHKCIRCKDTYITDTIEAVGHNYVNGVCTVCNDVKTITQAMSSQIRFVKNDDGSYSQTFDVRTRVKISDDDFATLIGATTEEAVKNIKKVGFVYSVNPESFSVEDAKLAAMGNNVAGYTDAPVKYIQDNDGYYMYTCLVTGIPSTETDNTLVSYAYICTEIDEVETWYFVESQTETDFASLYSANYPIACDKYGW